jgi:hypothetical protein
MVKVGQKYETLSSLLTGITEKDRVVTEGQLNLYPGMKVEIKETQ